MSSVVTSTHYPYIYIHTSLCVHVCVPGINSILFSIFIYIFINKYLFYACTVYTCFFTLSQYCCYRCYFLFFIIHLDSFSLSLIDWVLQTHYLSVIWTVRSELFVCALQTHYLSVIWTVRSKIYMYALQTHYLSVIWTVRSKIYMYALQTHYLSVIWTVRSKIYMSALQTHYLSVIWTVRSKIYMSALQTHYQSVGL